MDDLLTFIGNGGEIVAVKDAIVSAFRTAMPDIIQVYYGIPDVMHFPCLCVGDVQVSPNGTFGSASGSGMETLTITISVFSSSADEDGQRVLDALIGRHGHIRAALWEMKGQPGLAALGGAADDIALTEISGYGMVSVGDNTSLYSANLSVRVIVS
jgi:hypothetical protein